MYITVDSILKEHVFKDAVILAVTRAYQMLLSAYQFLIVLFAHKFLTLG